MHHWNLKSWCSQIPVSEEGKETFTCKESIALNNEKAEKLIRLKLPSVFLLQKQMKTRYRAKCVPLLTLPSEPASSRCVCCGPGKKIINKPKLVSIPIVCLDEK